MHLTQRYRGSLSGSLMSPDSMEAGCNQGGADPAGSNIIMEEMEVTILASHLGSASKAL